MRQVLDLPADGSDWTGVSADGSDGAGGKEGGEGKGGEGGANAGGSGGVGACEVESSSTSAKAVADLGDLGSMSGDDVFSERKVGARGAAGLNAEGGATEECPDVPGLFEEGEDFLKINGEKIAKPFVEKPVDAEDHNVYLYYKAANGGGSKRLFRKIGNKSSKFYKDISTVRRGGSYVYEHFLHTGGTDVKVYAVGAEYAHAEARKSPVVDGRVQRDSSGKEMRFPIILSLEEKMIARKVVLAFKYQVCGFDLLRHKGKSYVCDVNGWSFVKGSTRYYDDAAHIIRATCLKAMGRANHGPELPLSRSKSSRHRNRKGSRLLADGKGATNDLADNEELRCVIGVFRHGDRTPKQKMKMKVSHEHWMSFFDRYDTKHGRSSKKELKLKTAKQLQHVLDTTVARMKEMIASPGKLAEQESDLFDKLEQIRIVLGRASFSGINRKVRLRV